MTMNTRALARGACLALLLTLMCEFPSSAPAQSYTVLHNFTGAADGANPYAGITIDRAGNLLGTATGGGMGYGTVYKLKHSQSGYVFNLLYSFSGDVDGAYPFNGVVIGSDETLYGILTYGEAAVAVGLAAARSTT